MLLALFLIITFCHYLVPSPLCPLPLPLHILLFALFALLPQPLAICSLPFASYLVPFAPYPVLFALPPCSLDIVSSLMLFLLVLGPLYLALYLLPYALSPCDLSLYF